MADGLNVPIGRLRKMAERVNRVGIKPVHCWTHAKRKFYAIAGESPTRAIEERWALIFTGTAEFRVIGESVGQIAIGNTATDLAPINPETHAPYFRLRAAGWG